MGVAIILSISWLSLVVSTIPCDTCLGAIAGWLWDPSTSPHPPNAQDGKMQLTVLTDRSQGGSSLKDGSVELMVSGQSPVSACSHPGPLLGLESLFLLRSLLGAPYCL